MKYRPIAVLVFVAATLLSAQEGQEAKKPTGKPSSTIDQMIAAGRSREELAQYVFDTHACSGCHTIGSQGRLGFNERGKQTAKGFEGCISMLTAMTVIVQISDNKRTPQQRQKAQRFEEFGCTACHQITPGKMQLTDVGSKLAHLHLGCVDVEKVVAR